jgi:hypothetical protein
MAGSVGFIFIIFNIIALVVGDLSSIITLFPFLVLIFLSPFFRWPVSSASALMLISAYIVSVFAMSFNFPTLSGPDELAFYQNFSTYSFSELISQGIGTLKGVYAIIEERTVSLISSRMLFPAIISIVAPKSDIHIPPEFVQWVNVFLWSFASLVLARNANLRFEGVRSRYFTTAVMVFLLLSPSAIYWSSVFAKDIAVASFIAFTVVAYINKRYLIGSGTVIIAISLSAMAVPFILVLYALMLGKRRILFFMLFLSIAAILTASAMDLKAILNIIPYAGYTLLSPNPLNLENWVFVGGGGGNSWGLHPRGLFLAEGLFVTVTIVVGLLLASLDVTWRKVVIDCCVALLLIGCVWVLRGILTLDYYDVNMRGGNFVRYKVGAWPIIALIFGVAISHILEKVRKCRHD